MSLCEINKYFVCKRKNNRKLGKLRKGFAPSSRKRRYPIQPKDIVEFKGRRYMAVGTHNKGTRVIILVDGKKKSVSVKKLKVIYHTKSLYVTKIK